MAGQILQNILPEGKGLPDSAFCLIESGKILIALEIAGKIAFLCLQEFLIEGEILIVHLQALSAAEFPLDRVENARIRVRQSPAVLFAEDRVIDPERFLQPDRTKHGVRSLIFITGGIVHIYIPPQGAQLQKQRILEHLVSESAFHPNSDHFPAPVLSFSAVFSVSFDLFFIC